MTYAIWKFEKIKVLNKCISIRDKKVERILNGINDIYSNFIMTNSLILYEKWIKSWYDNLLQRVNRPYNT